MKDPLDKDGSCDNTAHLQLVCRSTVHIADPIKSLHVDLNK